MLEENRVHEGDCTILMKQVPVRSVDLIVTDPPYNASFDAIKSEWKKYQSINRSWDRIHDYQEFTNEWISEAIRTLRDGGTIYVFCSFHSIAEIINAMKNERLTIRDIIVWHKTNSVPNITQRGYAFSCEFIVWATKGSKWVFNYERMKQLNPDQTLEGEPKQMRDLWSFPTLGGKERFKAKNGSVLHPTQKPEILYRLIIEASSRKGDLIMDCFAGTNTAGIVAKKLGRRWLCLEIDPTFVRTGNERTERWKRLRDIMGGD